MTYKLDKRSIGFKNDIKSYPPKNWEKHPIQNSYFDVQEDELLSYKTHKSIYGIH